MDKSTVIPVGRGRVTLDTSLREYAGKGYYVSIRVDSRPGPCTDVDCQRILYPVVELTQLPDQSFKIFAGEGYFLALDDPVFMYIDRDRQEVTVRKSRLGKLTVKGLTF